MTQSSRLNWLVLLGVLLTSAAASALWLGTRPFADEDINLLLRLTARGAFVLFILILVARPLQQLLRSNWTATLLRRRRQLGVALAALMTTHLGLIAYRFGSQPELEYPLINTIVGGTAYLLLYLMLITSFDGPTRALGPKRWKLLHRTGLVVAAVIFGLPRSLEHAATWDYLKFGIPFAIALIIRITAWQLSKRRDSRRSPA